MNLYEDVSDCEVDHSFFDSDFEGEVKKDGTATKSAKAENSEHAQADSASLSKPDLKMETKGVEGVCTDKERHEKETEPRAEQCTFDNGIDENTLPLLASLNSDHANTSGGTIAQGKIKHENSIPTQDTKIVKEHEENYYTDEEDSSDDSRNQKVRLKLSKKSASTKAVKKITVSISSSSSSPSCSSDTDCSEAGSDGCLSDSSCSSKKKIACSFARLSPRQKSRPEQKFVEVKPKLGDCAEESEDTVTDVTPLSTPDISPIQSFELAASNDKKLKIKRQDNVSQDLCEPEKDHRCHQKVLHEAMDLNNLLKAFLQLEKKEQLNLVLDPPSTGSRKNYSFTNEEVRQIDQENQRLLKELAKQPRSKSASLKKPSVPAPKMYHSAINRQKEQQRIDRENLAFFKKLEAVKPTVGMKCSDQLRDYQRQMSYLNAAPPAPRRGKSALSHHSPSRGASQASSHSASSSASRKSESPMLDSPRRGLQRLSSANVHAAWL